MACWGLAPPTGQAGKPALLPWGRDNIKGRSKGAKSPLGVMAGAAPMTTHAGFPPKKARVWADQPLLATWGSLVLSGPASCSLGEPGALTAQQQRLFPGVHCPPWALTAALYLGVSPCTSCDPASWPRRPPQLCSLSDPSPCKENPEYQAARGWGHSLRESQIPSILKFKARKRLWGRMQTLHVLLSYKRGRGHLGKPALPLAACIPRLLALW